MLPGVFIIFSLFASAAIAQCLKTSKSSVIIEAMRSYKLSKVVNTLIHL